LAFKKSSRGCKRAAGEAARGGIGSFVRSGLHLGGAAEAVREQQKRE